MLVAALPYSPWTCNWGASKATPAHNAATSCEPHLRPAYKEYPGEEGGWREFKGMARVI